MKKYRYRIQERIMRSVWSIILLISVYILIRFAALTFSYDIGQARLSMKEVIISQLSVRLLESGSSLFRFAATTDQGEKYSYMADMVADKFLLYGFARENSSKIATAQENYAFQQEGFPFGSGDAKTRVSEGAASSMETGGANVMENAAENPEHWKAMQSMSEGILTKEYILSNGKLLVSSAPADSGGKGSILGSSNEMPADFRAGDIYYKEIEDDTKLSLIDGSQEAMQTQEAINFTRNQLMDLSFLIRNFYIVDSTTRITENLFDTKELLNKDMTIKSKNNKPQILIYHTHSQENYIDSHEGVEAETVVGVGEYLAQILEEQYDYQVIHDKTKYDLKNGVLNRSWAYNNAKPKIEELLKKYPSIEVIIDMHRDGTNAKRSTMIKGKETAQIMLFNGLCRDQNGPLTNYDNPYLQDNLAFGLQLHLKALEEYPGLFYKNYLKSYRYNQHFRPKTILMELGTNHNTLLSAQRAMSPFAKVLNEVLQGE